MRFATTRRSSSMPGGYVYDSSDRQEVAGKLRLRSTPAAFCRVPLISPSGLSDGHDRPAGAPSGDSLEEATGEQGGHRLLAVLGGDEETFHRPVGRGQGHTQRNAVPRAPVLLGPPAVEEVSRHVRHRSEGAAAP